jgi:uncharacterized NAD(P)/FAD-binding protein YdhS
MESAVNQIAIIGAGLSGRLLALNLLGQASNAVSIIMIDRSDAGSMGPAYSDGADHLLLNVPACRMGAYPEDPEHFLKWVRERGEDADQWDFLPRKLYRDYILGLLDNAQRSRTDGPSFEYIQEEVIDLEPVHGGIEIHTKGGAVFTADKAVLALGNFPPRRPDVQNHKALDSSRYMNEPWRSGVLDSLNPAAPIFLIGTGQTTVDLVLGLHKKGHTGGIIAVSRRGLLPLAHSVFEQYPTFYDEIKGSSSLLHIFRVVRKHLDLAGEMGVDLRAVIDSLRPATQIIWQGLPQEEKKRFLRHLFRYWEIIRSRIPPQSEAIIQEMRTSGQLEVFPGRVCDLVEVEGAMEVHYLPRDGTKTEVFVAARVINCIGPEADYSRIEHPLIKNLFRKGMIRPGPAQLGIDALPNGVILGADGAPSDVLFTLGSTMKGVLWEVIAVPEIRVQAAQIAQLLLEPVGEGEEMPSPFETKNSFSISGEEKTQFA